MRLGKTTMEVTTIPPVIAPVRPPPFVSLIARSATFVTVEQSHIVDVDVQLPAAPHAALRLGLRDGRERRAALFDYYRVTDLHLVEDFEIYRLADLRINR